MRYQYGELKNLSGEFYFCYYDNEDILREEFIAKYLIESINKLGNEGWKVLNVINKFEPCGFSGYDRLDYVLLEKQL